MRFGPALLCTTTDKSLEKDAPFRFPSAAQGWTGASKGCDFAELPIGDTWKHVHQRARRKEGSINNLLGYRRIETVRASERILVLTSTSHLRLS